MVDALKEFSGKEFTVSVADDVEAVFLLLQLLDVFIRAGWVFHPASRGRVCNTAYGDVGISDALSTGVFFHIPLSSEENSSEAFSALRFSGLKDARCFEDTENRFAGMFHVEVFKKDPGILDAMLNAKK